MLANFGLSAIVVSLTVLAHTVGLIALTGGMDRLNIYFRPHVRWHRRALEMIILVLGLFVLHIVEVVIWALTFQATGDFDRLDQSLYISALAFSTLGFSEVAIPEQWRLLVSVEGINGFLLIGWSTAYLVAASTRYGPFKTGTHF